MTPEIIFEDASLVVISKPSGMTSNSAESVQGESVQSWHKNRVGIEGGEGEFWEKDGLVHRLDKDTSGVMVLAKTPEAYEKLKEQFLERKTVKRYVALVHGVFKEKEGIITEPLMRHPKDRHRFTVGGDVDKSAITEWKVIKEFESPKVRGEKLTVLELTPHTGRTHQLRAHLQHISHPIVSDPIYGWAKKVKYDLEWCPRLFLHAKYLEFIHPVSGKRVHFEADLPVELSGVLVD